MLEFHLSTILWTVINLLVLYLFLRKFLFGRINAVLEKREAMVKQNLDAAEESNCLLYTSTEQMLWEQGRQKEEVCRRFAVLLDHPKTLLVAYNAQFDLCFLYYFLLPFGQTGLLKQIKMLDAMTIYKDRRAYPHKLENAVAAYALKTQNTHRAIDDTKAAFELLQAMEQERADLEQYINLFGYHPKYGVSGPRISSITYRAQAYGLSLIHL